jgi:predicted cupin superfamily sugar epimerase
VTAERLIRLLDLAPHPEEGGFFRETYRSSTTFEPGAPFTGTRSHGTAIYYLLTWDTYSAMHRLPGDEVFHFYMGDPVEMLMLPPAGDGDVVVLGQDIAAGMKLQHVVPGGTWQGSRLAAGGAWALLGATMAPGFDYADYVAGSASLLDAYPAHRAMIQQLLG